MARPTPPGLRARTRPRLSSGRDLLGALGLPQRSLLGLSALQSGQLGGLGLVHARSLGGGPLLGRVVSYVPDAHTHRHLHRVSGRIVRFQLVFVLGLWYNNYSIPPYFFIHEVIL